MSNTRQQAHQLIDRMPETLISGLVQFLETIVDPAATVLRPLRWMTNRTDVEKAAVTEAMTWFRTTAAKVSLTPKPCRGSDWSTGDRIDRDRLG